MSATMQADKALKQADIWQGQYYVDDKKAGLVTVSDAELSR